MHQNKEEILMHYENSVEWVRNLDNLSEEQWRTPIAEGKWTIAEVIGHLPAWDQFILDSRLPYLFKNRALPEGPEVDELNQQCSLESQSKTKEEIISKFIKVRRSLIIAVNNIEDDLWETKVNIGSTALILTDYLKGSIEHDHHHFKQIENILEGSKKVT
ncbi:DinB family protein [Ureibacillus chungkukjangi]|uniref:DinB family protein n=2 Tax=Ureibacillus chungkukjangi TaxID=1202712 RepID=A0A318TPS5_9BACL|nr:DinB family protein [Ureibacillus chungkukjangi]MCM3388754.1 DinB family protein [Ureibacillus chungkukjangi]PYF06664.1 DinB family protein [Ureibacillus chungkukjangi]